LDPSSLFTLGSGTLDASGTGGIGIPVSADPALTGAMLYSQGLVGSTSPHFTNAQELTFLAL
jgi:hypothetical protein